MAVAGTWQREGDTASLIAGYLEDLTPLLGPLSTPGELLLQVEDSRRRLDSGRRERNRRVCCAR
jgi:hypothetical protein